MALIQFVSMSKKYVPNTKYNMWMIIKPKQTGTGCFPT